MRVRFSFAGLSGETSGLGPAQTVSAADDHSNTSIDSSNYMIFNEMKCNKSSDLTNIEAKKKNVFHLIILWYLSADYYQTFFLIYKF